MSRDEAAARHSAAPTRLEPKSADRRRQIMDAFAWCAGTKGLEQTTVADIAETAGIQRTLVYHYFSDRQSLIDSLIEHIFRELEYPEFPDLAAPLEKLDAALDFYFSNDYFESHRHIIACWSEITLLANRDDSVRSRLREVYDEGFLWFEQLLMKAYPSKPRDSYTLVTYSFIALMDQTHELLMQGLGEERTAHGRRAVARIVETLETT
jgi:AcrR family transcriptional regulator